MGFGEDLSGLSFRRDPDASRDVSVRGAGPGIQALVRDAASDCGTRADRNRLEWIARSDVEDRPALALQSIVLGAESAQASSNGVRSGQQLFARQQAPEEIDPEQLAAELLGECLRAVHDIRKPRAIIVAAQDSCRLDLLRPEREVLGQYRIGVHGVFVIDVDRIGPVFELDGRIPLQRADVRAVGRVDFELFDAVLDAEAGFHRAHAFVLFPRVDAIDGGRGVDAFGPCPARAAEKRSHFHDLAVLRHECCDGFDGFELVLGDLAGDG